MNKKQQELLDEAYEDYVKIVEANKELYLERDGYTRDILTKDEFKIESKYNYMFSEKWELKIEERELFKLERINVAIEKKLTHKTAHLTKDFDYQKWCDEQNIPTKLITITYNDQTIESYE